jgi:glycine cleavage system aminomethyltransferase T
VELQVPDEVIGIQALRRIHAAGPRRHQLGLVLHDDEPIVLRSSWHTIRRGNETVGSLTNCMWSYRLRKNIGYALISTACNPGDSVEVMRDGRPIAGVLTGLPFL